MNRRKVSETAASAAEDGGEADSLLDKPAVSQQPHRGSNRFGRSCMICTLLAVGVTLWLAYSTITLIRDVFPETDLVLNSKCSAPMQNWDGKLLNVPIWWSSYTNRKPYYNLHYENQYKGNDTNHHIYLSGNAGAKRPVVLFGTHHKTGTFLAKKLFARICSKMNWCCLFHVTRDSIHALSNALQTEPVNALGHNQWIWDPKALDIADYRFVHFYRHPYKKVISGYRYHADGTEEWTQKPLTYNEICTSPLRSTVSTGKSVEAADPKAVWKFCEAIHLCETCCRMEHEIEVAGKGSSSPAQITSFRRPAAEYQFLCDRLGSGKQVMDRALDEQMKQHPASLRNFHHTATPSIQEMLLAQPARDGVLTEAALDYYENLRMAHIINVTAGDPHTLNIDIDDLNENFSDVTMRLLRFLEGDIIPSRRIKELHKDLAFYDLQTSPVYRWSMSNPIINHITGTAGGGSSSSPAPAPSAPGSSGGTLKGSSAQPGLKGATNSSSAAVRWQDLPTVTSASSSYLMGVLRSDPQVNHLYAPILEMMRSVLPSASQTTPVSDGSKSGVDVDAHN